VVAVTGSLLPFEVYELFHHFRWIRVLVLLINGAVVVFLVFHARGMSRGFDDEPPRPGPPRRTEDTPRPGTIPGEQPPPA
jgi:hypothetical protein